MNANKAKAAAKTQAIEELRSRGAELAKMEDRHGDTRSGWWLDGVWLAPASDPAAALRVMNAETMMAEAIDGA